MSGTTSLFVRASAFGIAWLNMLERIKGKPNAYMLTLVLFGVFLAFVFLEIRALAVKISTVKS